MKDATSNKGSAGRPVTTPDEPGTYVHRDGEWQRVSNQAASELGRDERWMVVGGNVLESEMPVCGLRFKGPEQDHMAYIIYLSEDEYQRLMASDLEGRSIPPDIKQRMLNIMSDG